MVSLSQASLSVLSIRWSVTVERCSHASLIGSSATIVGLTDDVGVLEHGVMDLGEVMRLGHLTSGRVSAKRPPKEQDERLWLVDLVVDPAAGLLDSEMAPLFFVEQAAAGHVTVHALRQQHVPVLILIILVLLRVLNLIREMRHFSYL